MKRTHTRIRARCNTTANRKETRISSLPSSFFPSPIPHLELYDCGKAWKNNYFYTQNKNKMSGNETPDYRVASCEVVDIFKTGSPSRVATIFYKQNGGNAV